MEWGHTGGRHTQREDAGKETTQNEYYTEKEEKIHREEIHYGKGIHYREETHRERGHTAKGQTAEREHW